LPLFLLSSLFLLLLSFFLLSVTFIYVLPRLLTSMYFPAYWHLASFPPFLISFAFLRVSPQLPFLQRCDSTISRSKCWLSYTVF
jgi:hypothetical protein